MTQPMRHISFNVTVIRRQPRVDSKRKSRELKQGSALRAAAYQRGTALTNTQSLKRYDFRGKEDVSHCEIMAPLNAPDWVFDPMSLWNKAETAERRKDAQLCRAIIASLPQDLTPEQNIELVKKWVSNNLTIRGMAVDIAFHSLSTPNPHAHMLMPMRRLEGNGFAPHKARELNNRTWVKSLRTTMAQCQTDALRAAGINRFMFAESYRSLNSQLVPTLHLGAACTALAKRGFSTPRSDFNGQARAVNEQLHKYRWSVEDDHALEQLEAELLELEHDLEALPTQTIMMPQTVQELARDADHHARLAMDVDVVPEPLGTGL